MEENLRSYLDTLEKKINTWFDIEEPGWPSTLALLIRIMTQVVIPDDITVSAKLPTRRTLEEWEERSSLKGATLEWWQSNGEEDIYENCYTKTGSRDVYAVMQKSMDDIIVGMESKEIDDVFDFIDRIIARASQLDQRQDAIYDELYDVLMELSYNVGLRFTYKQYSDCFDLTCDECVIGEHEKVTEGHVRKAHHHICEYLCVSE